MVAIMISAVIFSVIAWRYSVGNVPGFDILAEDLTLFAPIVVTVLIASLMGGWVFSSSVSENSEIREIINNIELMVLFERLTQIVYLQWFVVFAIKPYMDRIEEK